jgi:iron complex transport system permease protein
VGQISVKIPGQFSVTINIIGIVGPYVARLLLGEDQRFFLPGAMLAGALILSATSVLSKALFGAVLPIGNVTALVGAPFFAALILTKGRKAW